MVLGRSMEVSPLQPENAEPPIVVTELGIVTFVNPVHPEKVLFPIDVMVLGRSMEVSPLQFSNADPPMEVTEFGIVMLVIFEPFTKSLGSCCTSFPMVTLSILVLGIDPIEPQFVFHVKSFIPEHPSNALASMVVTEYGILTLLRPVHPEKVLFSIDVMVLGRSMEVSPLQSRNAQEPIEVTELGIVTSVRLVQPENAELPIVMTELGRSMEVSPLQFSNAYPPMEVTELGIVTLVSEEQSLNTPSLIEVTASGMIMVVREEQFQNAYLLM